jgi:hypothetical protein
MNQLTNAMDTTIALPRGQAELCGSTVEMIACEMWIAGIECQVLPPGSLIYRRIAHDKTF